MTKAEAKQVDRMTRQIEQILQDDFQSQHSKSKITVYRYNPGSIRIRIVDPSFAGKSLSEREAAVWKILEKLPEQVQLEISVCLLIAPNEQATSLMNLEFEQPLPSGF